MNPDLSPGLVGNPGVLLSPSELGPACEPLAAFPLLRRTLVLLEEAPPTPADDHVLT